MDLFARWTADAKGDLARTWCWQPNDAATIALPSRACSREEIEAEGFDPDEIEWTGANWSTREPGIPGFLVDEDDDESILISVPATGNVSAGAGRSLVLFEGEYEGTEYEASISGGNASRFTPRAIIRIIK